MKKDEGRVEKYDKDMKNKMKIFPFYVFSILHFSEDHITPYRLILEKLGTPQPLKKFVPSYET